MSHDGPIKQLDASSAGYIHKHQQLHQRLQARTPVPTVTGPPPESVMLVAASGAMPSLADTFNDEFTDCSMVSGDSDEFRCHRHVLAMWSKPLKRMLLGGMLEASQQRITISNADSQVLEAFLRFLYGLPAHCPTGKLVVLCALADQYDVAALQAATKGAVMSHSVYDAVLCCRAYIDAKLYGIRYLQDHCWLHLVAHLGELLQEPEDLGQLDLEDVYRLLSLSGQRIVPPARPLGSLAASVVEAVGGANRSSAPRIRPTHLTFGKPKFGSPFWEVSELTLFYAAMCWVGADLQPRLQHLDDLLQHINLERVSFADMQSIREHPVAVLSARWPLLLEDRGMVLTQ